MTKFYRELGLFQRNLSRFLNQLGSRILQARGTISKRARLNLQKLTSCWRGWRGFSNSVCSPPPTSVLSGITNCVLGVSPSGKSNLCRRFQLHSCIFQNMTRLEASSSIALPAQSSRLIRHQTILQIPDQRMVNMPAQLMNKTTRKQTEFKDKDKQGTNSPVLA